MRLKGKFEIKTQDLHTNQEFSSRGFLSCTYIEARVFIYVYFGLSMSYIYDMK